MRKKFGREKGNFFLKSLFRNLGLRHFFRPIQTRHQVSAYAAKDMVGGSRERSTNYYEQTGDRVLRNAYGE